jgi:hypothetical protein
VKEISEVSFTSNRSILQEQEINLRPSTRITKMKELIDITRVESVSCDQCGKVTAGKWYSPLRDLREIYSGVTNAAFGIGKTRRGIRTLRPGMALRSEGSNRVSRNLGGIICRFDIDIRLTREARTAI